MSSRARFNPNDAQEYRPSFHEKPKHLERGTGVDCIW
jgi:hypothetical protein